MKWMVLIFLVPLAAAQCPTTAGASICTTSVPVTNCGFPGYNCALQDGTRRTYSFSEIPPDAGPAHCTHPLLSCNNRYGLNTVITEPEYKNAHIVRITDGGDFDSGCNSPSVGPGGAAEFNIFEMHSNFLVVGCTASDGIKWINPATGQVITTVDPQGWVLQSSGSSKFLTSGSIRFAYNHANTFFNFPVSTQVIEQSITNGRVDAATTVVADFVYAVPCWHDAAVMHPNVGECGEWAQNHTYPPGSTLCPSCSVWTASTPGVNVPGTCPQGAQAGACAGPHSFALINPAACQSGGTQPNWASVTAVPLTTANTGITSGPYSVPGVSVEGFSQWALHDGTCIWGDMWIPPQYAGGAIKWNPGKVGDSTDTIWSEGLSNHGGQDGAGACYAVWYNSGTKTYSYLNACTGSIYNTVCSGGTNYACAGGTWAQTYLGNAFSTTTTTCGAVNPHVLHQNFGSKSNLWSYITGGDNAMGGIPFIDSGGYRIPMDSASTCTGVWFWWAGTLKFIEARSSGAVGAFGHMVPGFNTWIWRPPALSSPVLYLGSNFSNIPAGVWPGTPLPVVHTYFNVNDSTCNSGAGNWGCALVGAPQPPANVFHCSPNPCIGPQAGNASLLWRVVDFDEHSSWISNTGTDTTPICDQIYWGPFNRAFFPPKFAWVNEVFCFQTDGSNRTAREAYMWNSWSVPSTGTGQFSNAASIGSLSSDGGWWAFNSDWYCTLGLINTANTPLCGLVFWPNTAYQVGDMLGVSYGSGQIYKVTVAGTTSATQPADSDYCTTANCTFTNGGVTFQYQGTMNMQSSVFLVKLQ